MSYEHNRFVRQQKSKLSNLVSEHELYPLYTSDEESLWDCTTWA